MKMSCRPRSVNSRAGESRSLGKNVKLLRGVRKISPGNDAISLTSQLSILLAIAMSDLEPPGVLRENLFPPT